MVSRLCKIVLNLFIILFAFIVFILTLYNFLYAAETPVINEFLAHPSSGNKEWVEFYNPDHLDLSTYWLDDDTDFNIDSGNSPKKILSSVNTDNPSYPYFELSSFLNNSGDYLVLFSQSGDIIDQYRYTKDPGVDVSMGRFPDGDLEIVILAAATKGSPNSPALPTNTPTVTKTPANTPAPKNTPTVKISTPTKMPASFLVASASKLPSQTAMPSDASGQKSAGISADILPTSVLGESTAGAAISKNKAKKETTKIETLGAKEDNMPKVLIALGTLLLVVCGVFIFLNYRRSEITSSE